MDFKKNLFVVIVLFSPFWNIYGYTPETTHSGLTEQSVYFYDKNFSNKLTDAEKELIIKGSIAEDYPEIRVLNHFYDPVRNIGINNFRTTKEWVMSPITDNIYTWPEAIRLYAEGDKDKAFIYLGHILHLTQDMTVPDHTRNDPHIGKGLLGLYTGQSTYETWASQNKNRITLQDLNKLYLNQKPKEFLSINDYLDFLANYSNRNFFGDDFSNIYGYHYDEPFILEYRDGYAYGLDSIQKDKIKLLITKDNGNGGFSYSLLKGNDTSVLSGYFDRLGKQAILSSAGVIDLFLKEGETARQAYLKEKAFQAQAEIEKAIALNKDLSNSNYLKLALFGLGSILQDNFISPIIKSTSNIASGFYQGANVIASETESAGSFLSYTSGALLSEAIKEIKTSIVSSFSAINRIAVSNSQNNLATIPSGSIVEKPMTEIALADPSVQSPEQNQGTIVTDNTPNIEVDLENLQKAYEILVNLKSNLQNTAPVFVNRTVNNVSGAAFPILTGEGAKPVDNLPNNTFGNDVSKEGDGDKPVDKVEDKDVDNSKITNENNDNSTTTENNFSNSTTTDSVATSTEEKIEEKDTTPPEVSIFISECQNSLSPSICLVSTTTLSIRWNSSAEDLGYFEFNMNGVISTTTATSTIFIGSDNSRANFSVSAIDISGNKSSTVEIFADIVKTPIVINEIAWNGTVGHPEDEWLELYNQTDKNISLDKFVLYSKTDMSPYIKLSGVIPPKGYYLIESKQSGETDESTQSPIKDIPADLWTDFGAGLSNTGENLILSYSSTTIDEVSYSFNWGGVYNQRTSEKFGFDESWSSWNWTGNNGEIYNGKNVSGAAIYGTPKARNSANYLISRNSTITNDITLKKDRSPYFIPKNTTVDIKSSAVTTIEPGVVLKFAEGSLFKTAGKILANGDAENPIVFTSLLDDDYGGDTNGDGVCQRGNASNTAVCPVTGSWYGVQLLSAPGTSVFNNSIFRYGGIDYGVKVGALYVESSAVDISNSIFEQSAPYGVNMRYSSGNISSCKFRKNDNTSATVGLNITAGSPVVNNNEFSLNSIGITSNVSNAVITNNTFDGNKVRAISLINKIGGDVSGNSSVSGSATAIPNLISISGQISTSNSTTTLVANPMPYFVYGTAEVVAGSALQIKEGAKILNSSIGEPSRLLVNGYLSVEGTSANPVIFSSNLDNAPKDSWFGVILNTDSYSDIKGAVFRDSSSAIKYYKSPVNLEDVEFRNNTVGLSVLTYYPSPVQKAINVYFANDNTATTSPLGLW
ncbi:MAG: hypothetical protein WCO84_04135 [bacterium]